MEGMWVFVSEKENERSEFSCSIGVIWGHSQYGLSNNTALLTTHLGNYLTIL